MIYSRTGKLRRLGIVMAAILVFLMFEGRGLAEAANDDLSQLMPIAGGALVEAGQHHWDKAAAELGQFEAIWKMLGLSSAAGADKISAAIAETKKALTDADANPDKAYQAFSKLTKATDDFVADKGAVQGGGDAKVLAKGLLPILQQTIAAVNQGDWVNANSQYKQFQTQWKKIESAVITDNIEAYRSMEIQITLARVSLQVEPPKAETANNAVADLIRSLEDYMSGQATSAATPPADKQTVADLMKILQKAQADLNADQPASAAKQMQTFIRLWPTAEGEVKSRSSSAYADIENKMSEASSYLLSSPPKVDDAKKTIVDMLGQLEPYTNKTSYTAWDAGLILLRDGVEALLVIAAFLAFMHRTGNGSKQKWVWSGAGTGLVLSGLLALLLTYTIANVAASSAREFIEGITGIVSVIFMITVGAWLHGKASTKAWNQYINEQVGIALASGKLWYLFVIACLTILREGAETTIFYIGMASMIEPSQLILGIGAASLVLLVLGIVIVRGSVRLPIGPFFAVATVFVYYLVIKFLGQSIHSLQVAGEVSAHANGFLPSIAWLGVYPTWETSALQWVVLAFIILQMVRFARKNRDGSSSAKSGTA
jgi:high-affinity iron transporter